MSNLPAVNKVSTIRDLLYKSKTQIAMALPKHLNPDRMLRIAMTSIQQNWRLMECDPKSLVACIIEAAQLGLEPDGVLGHAYLIPYKIKGTYKAQLQIGYRGYIDLARRSGQVAALYAHVVHEKDEWEFEYGLEPKLKHIPTAEEDPGLVIAAYAVVRLKDGGYDFEWLWKREIDAVRRQSKAADDGPWVTHYEEMAKKTAIRRLAKRLPLSIEFQRAAVADEYVDAGVSQDLIDSTTDEIIDVEDKSKAKIESLKEKLKEAKEEEPAMVQPEPQTQEPPKDLEMDPFRKEYINLRSRGFSTWVYKNLERIKQADPEYQAEIREKWEKLYKDVNFPLDPEPDEPSATAGERKTVWCPEKEGSYVFLEVCEAKCDKKESCVAYREAVMQPGEVEDEGNGIPEK